MSLTDSAHGSGPDGAVLLAAALTIGFALKHYLADFVLQTNWIARGKERGQGWLAPLVAHAAVHAAVTFGIVIVLAPHLWWLAPADFTVHVLIDRGKTLASHRFRLKPDQASFWWLLGFDQLLHQITNVVLASAIVLL